MSPDELRQQIQRRLAVIDRALPLHDPTPSYMSGQADGREMAIDAAVHFLDELQQANGTMSGFVEAKRLIEQLKDENSRLRDLAQSAAVVERAYRFDQLHIDDIRTLRQRLDAVEIYIQDPRT